MIVELVAEAASRASFSSRPLCCQTLIHRSVMGKTDAVQT
jgi:hypothetical protein